MADEPENRPPPREPQRQGTTDYQMAARLGAKIRDQSARRKEAEAKAKALEERLQAMEAETARLAKAADGNSAAKELARVRQELRDAKHKSAFDAIALARGIDPKRLEVLRKISDYQPETDEPDPQLIEGKIEALRAEHDYLFAKPTPPPAPPPVAAPPNGSSGGPQVTGGQAPEVLYPGRQGPGPAAGRGDGLAPGSDPLSRPPDQWDAVSAMLHYNEYTAANKASRDKDGGIQQGWNRAAPQQTSRSRFTPSGSE